MSRNPQIITIIIFASILCNLLLSADCDNVPLKRAKAQVHLGISSSCKMPRIKMGVQAPSAPVASVTNVNVAGVMGKPQTYESKWDENAFTFPKKPLGVGAYGTVWKATCKETNKVYAIKIIPFQNDVDIRKHIADEMRIQKELKSKYFVHLHKVYQDIATKKHYMQTELVEGGEFFDLMISVLGAEEFGYWEKLSRSNGRVLSSSMGRFPDNHARFYAAEILLALEYLHERDIVHRDIKPENILLTLEGHIKITDFGLSFEIKEGERNYEECGTPGYYPPEIVTCAGVNKTADTWALGVILYTILEGCPPFLGAHTAEAKKQLVANKPVYDRKHFTELAEDLTRNLLHSDPDQRYTVAQAKNHEFFTKHPGWDWNNVETLKEKFRPKGGFYLYFDKDNVEKYIRKVK